MHRFASLALKSRIAAAMGLFPGIPCSDSQVYPMKSGIAATPRLFLRDSLQRLPNSPPEIKNRCSNGLVSGYSLQRLPSLPPEIKNRCSNGVVSGHSLQRFSSLPHEIRNHCSRGVVAFCRRNHSPSRQQRLESDAELVVATADASGPFFFAATKIRIGRGTRCSHGCCRRTIHLCDDED